MLYRWISLFMLCACVWGATPVEGKNGDLSSIIESFVNRQFPDSRSHYWVVNSAQRNRDEVVVDVNTIVLERRQTEPRENRFLLLIVAGELTATQNIPLDASAECKPEQA